MNGFSENDLAVLQLQLIKARNLLERSRNGFCGGECRKDDCPMWDKTNERCGIKRVTKRLAFYSYLLARAI